MSKKKENREEEKEQSSSRSVLTYEQIESALNACTFGHTKETRCKDCPLDSEKEPCITNLHLAALEYIGRLKHRAARAERALLTVCTNIVTDEEDDLAIEPRARVLYKAYLKQAEKELAEERKDD